MTQISTIQDYFIKIHKTYGLSEVEFKNNRLIIDETNMRNAVFMLDDLGEEFENMIAYCEMIYQELQTGFSLQVNNDQNNQYLVNILN